MTPALLDVHGLTVSYLGRRVLDLPRLTIAPGEVVGVVGANGAGKSTLVNAILGWVHGGARVTGQLSFNGARIDAWPTHRRVRNGVVLVAEGRASFLNMTVSDNLQPPFAVQPESGRHVYSLDEVYALFPRLKERQEHLGQQLSGGERQMLGIARALMTGPRLMLLDEPSIGLAPMLVAQVFETLRALAETGLTILLVEQNFRAAVRIVDRVLLLEHGRVVLEGPAGDISADPRIASAYLGVNES